MFLRFLCSLAVLNFFGFNFNVFASERLCRALSVKDTCADKVADLKHKQPLKLMAQLMWSFEVMEFMPHEDTKKVLVDSNVLQVPEEINKKEPDMDLTYTYITIPVEPGPFYLTCANDRDVFPNACSGHLAYEVFTLKKALRQVSEKMVHERALYDIPNIHEDMLKRLREGMVKQNFPSEIFTLGAAWYIFSDYDAETKETKDVMKGLFSLGHFIGTCEKEYKVNGTACFGMQKTSRPAVDPPKPPALPDTVQPPIPELKANKPPAGGSSTRVIIAVVVVVVILLLMGADFLYVRRKKIEGAHGREVQMT